MRQVILIGTAVALLSGATPSWSQAVDGQVDPDAVAALRKMGQALSGLQSFALDADVTRDEVLESGQKLKFAGTVQIKARRPNALRMEVKSDRQDRLLIYDGTKATLFSPRVGYFATFDAPSNIGGMLRVASDKYGIETPLADLFDWANSADPARELKSAFLVDTETVAGIACDHYAMRQDGSDWQIWIRKSGEALPCKLVITTTDDPSAPEFTAVYRWNSQPSLAASDFSFSAPPNARKITFGAIPASASAN